MKTLFLVIALCVLASCQRTAENSKIDNKVASSLSSGCGEENVPPVFIPLDSANKMINSYLASLNAPANQPDLYSVIFNADSLRAMLNDTLNGKIAKVKIMLAHTLSYINASGSGIPCGYRSGKLTFVIAGYDCENNYVLNPAGKVINNGMPCPTNCPPDGTAASNLISTN